ncbi:50S ribosomal protein L18Ae [archaeon]
MVKVYRINGIFGQKGEKQGFTIDVRATKPEDAKETVYTEVGSKHKCKRPQIIINSVEEIPSEDTKSLLVKQLSEVE